MSEKIHRVVELFVGQCWYSGGRGGTTRTDYRLPYAVLAPFLVVAG